MVYILIVLIAGTWVAGPWDFPSKEVCEQAYGVVKETYQDEKLTPPDHICAEREKK